MEPPRIPTVALANALPHEPVRLEGWVHRRRGLASVTFLIVRDRTGLAQVVLPADTPVPPEETPVRVTGAATHNPKAPGGVELTDAIVELLSEPALTPPAELWRPVLDVGLPTLLDHAPLLWRHPVQRVRWELAAATLRGFRDTLNGLGFTEICTPKLVEVATETGANVFQVDYFGRPAYLAQSPQFYKQQLVGVFERVYEVGPVFRAEPHDTVRHLSEYRSLDVELGFIRDHRDVLNVLREVLIGMVAGIEEHALAAVDRLGLTLPAIPKEIPIVHFTEALRIAKAPDDEPDLAPEYERAIGAWALTEHGSDVVAVEGYPMRKRPFYTHPWSRDGATSSKFSNSFDLIFRGTELVTGGQRLHEPATYDAAIRARGEDPAEYDAYLQTFRHGMPPHGGFAIGLERWVARLVGAANIREVTLFPRDLHRLTP